MIPFVFRLFMSMRPSVLSDTDNEMRIVAATSLSLSKHASVGGKDAAATLEAHREICIGQNTSVGS